MPAVSVLLPCYNVAGTLSEALDSLVSQTFADFEVIAVDDGSSDMTAAILEEWASRDSRFRLLSQLHGGIIPALNAGLAVCRVPYVARMDADDRCQPERLGARVCVLEAPGVRHHGRV